MLPNQRVFASLTALAATVLLARSAEAQCIADWVPGYAYPGIYGGAGEAVRWDPDGPGPQPEMLVITGEFDAIGGVAAYNVAAWDGIQWRALGAGFGGRSFSDSFGECNRYWHFALGVNDGELYAGVNLNGHCPRPFSSMDVLHWNGSTWDTIAQGGGGYHDIATLCSFQGELIVAGSFANIAGVSAHNIARWNGEEWRPLGVNPSDGLDGAAVDMLVHDGRLIVAGYFTSAGGVAARNIASWDGEMWHALGAGLGGEYGVQALAVYDNELVAGGSFDASTGDPEHIARWDGAQWQPLGAGIGGADGVYLNSLTDYSGELIVGGYFDEAGGAPARGAASWNGAEWRPWGDGMDYLFAFGVCQGSLLAGGALANIARWDGTSWNYFGDGLNRPVVALASHNGELIGAMDADWGMAACNAGLPAIVSRWDGQCWNPLETRHSSDPGIASVMTSFGTDLVVGGRFATMDGVPAANIASWDGAHWHALGDGLGIPNGSVDPIVRALAVYDGHLVAGGTFRTTGGADAERVARWDGTQWQPIGAGFPNSFPGTPFVAALAVYNGDLYAGGRFDFNGLRAGVARWDSAAALWQPVDQLATINDIVWTLAVYGNELIAGGRVAGEGAAFNPYIARWDGAQWSALGDGLAPAPEPQPAYAFVSNLALAGPDLIVGGSFGFAGGSPVNNIARWDGTHWHDMGAGVTLGFAAPYSSPAVYALATHAGALAVGGNFLFAGDHASAYFAQWRCPPRPADLNCDAAVDNGDVEAFVLALIDPSAYRAAYPNCDMMNADTNHDGAVDNGDIDSFVQCLLNGGCQ